MLTAAPAILPGLEALGLGLAVWEADGRLAYCNTAFRGTFHWMAPLLEPGLAHDAFVAGLAASNEIVLEEPPGDWAGRHADAFRRAAIFEHRLSDGRSIEIAYHPAAGGGTTTVVSDITVLKRGERALRRAKEIAEAADQSKSRFLWAANHDLRQPLATLRILIYNCMTEAEEDHRKDLLHAMDISVSIMEDLLGALLQIGQLDAGQIEPRITTFQLSPLLERLKIQFGHVAREKGLDLAIVHSRQAVTSDKALLERILSNFIGNAIRYTEVGRVLIGCRREGSHLRLEVWDTGRGIPGEHIDRIFEEFYQVANPRYPRSKGLGLGLSIVKRLAALLNHPISVTSTPTRGSCFAIRVPIGNVWQSELGEPEINEMIGGEFAGIPALVVEDDEVLRQAMKELLERWGLVVRTVNGTEQALHLLREEGFAPRIVIADYSLRGQQGTDVVRRIRAHLARDIPGLIVTADADPKLVQKIKDEGFPVLIKPVGPPRLRVAMHSLLYEPDTAAQVSG